MIERPPSARRVESPDERTVGLTDVGLRRSRNEDDFLVDAGGRLLVVADGLGGLPGGHVASRTAVASLAERLSAAMDDGAGPFADYHGARDELIGAVYAAHDAVVARGASDPTIAGMATTIVFAKVVANTAFVSHVGDVRAYAGRAGRLTQLTNDHSLVGELVAAGRLTPEQARLHPRKNIVTQALGLEDAPMPSFTTADLEDGDLLLLCSDGLWESMPAAQLERIAAEAEDADDPQAVERTAVALADVAIEAGGHDNISLVLYRHSR